MKNRAIFCVIYLVCVTTVSSIPQEIVDKAYEYRGYDELLSNITPVEYKNRTYYWVDYSKTLMYSGSLLLNEEPRPVTDNETLRAFASANVIHKNFGVGGVEQLRRFSGYYGSLAKNIRDPSLEAVANDSREISRLFSESSGHLKECINSFSPDDAGDYLLLDSLLMERMRAAYRNVKGRDNTSALINYQNSLVDIYGVLKGNRENLLESSEFITRNIRSRIGSKDTGSETEIILAALAVLLLLSLFFIQRSRKKLAGF